jgi:hypothetical protein
MVIRRVDTRQIYMDRVYIYTERCGSFSFGTPTAISAELALRLLKECVHILALY